MQRPRIWSGSKNDRAAPHPALGVWCIYYLMDDDGVVQYVGMTRQWWKRIHGHRRKSWWTCWVVQECADEQDAAASESLAIRHWDPPQNIAGRV